MSGKIHIMHVILLTLFVVVIASESQSQDIGAVYWFKKGVNERNQQKKIEYYQRAIKENPEFVEAHYNLALIFMIRKDYARAEQSFKNALSAKPGAITNSVKSNILNRLGTLYRKTARYQEAEQAFQGALSIARDKKFRALTLYELGQTKVAEGKYDEAINYFKEGIKISPGDRLSFETGIQLAKNQQQVERLYQQGVKLVETQKFAEASDIFKKVLEQNPNHKKARQQLQQISALQKKKEVQRKQDIDPLYQRAMAYLKQQNWSEAIKNLENIKSQQPDYPGLDSLIRHAKGKQYEQLITTQQLENYYVKAVGSFKARNYVVALENFKKVAELNPNYKDVMQQIKATEKAISRSSQKSQPPSQREEVILTEFDNTTQLEATTIPAPDVNAQQIVSEKSRQLNAAIDSQLVQTYYNEALNLMQAANWQRAMILLEKIRLINPDYKNTDFLLSQAKQNLQTTRIAAPDKNTLSQKSQGPSPVIFAFLAGLVVLPVTLVFLSPNARARYYILTRQFGKAQAIYERMLTKKPNNVKLYITLANIYINQNRIDEISIRVFEHAIQYNENLKLQLEPIVTRYYLQKSKSPATPKSLLQGALKDELDRMGS